jgi:hypothetical protein
MYKNSQVKMPYFVYRGMYLAIRFSMSPCLITTESRKFASHVPPPPQPTDSFQRKETSVQKNNLCWFLSIFLLQFSSPILKKARVNDFLSFLATRLSMSPFLIILATRWSMGVASSLPDLFLTTLAIMCSSSCARLITLLLPK